MAHRIVTKKPTLRTPQIQSCHDFIQWHREAEHGDIYTYFRGKHLNIHHETTLLGAFIYRFALEGKVYLVRKKLGPSDFEYRCFKVKKALPYLVPKEIKTPPSMRSVSKVSVERASI